MVGFMVFENATRNFFEIHFFNVGGVGEGMEKAGSLFGVACLFCVILKF